MSVNVNGKKRTFEECFQIFESIHQLTTSPEDILMVAKYAIKEFSENGVKFLDLKSTPEEKML